MPFVHATLLALIVTVPLGVLQASAESPSAIRFAPQLTTKASALESMAMGSTLRVTLRFENHFWSRERFARQRGVDDLNALSFLHSADSDFPTWWSAYPMTAPLLVGWSGGMRARRLSSLTHDEIAVALDVAVSTVARDLRLAIAWLNEQLRLDD